MSGWYEAWVRDRANGRPLYRVQIMYRSSGETWWQNLGGALADQDTAFLIADFQNRTGHVARVVPEAEVVA